MTTRGLIRLVWPPLVFLTVVYLSFKYAQAPFMWIWASLLVLAGMLAWKASTDNTRVWWVNVAAAFLALTLFEAYQWRGDAQRTIRFENLYDGFYVKPHNVLGYALKPGVVKPHAAKYVKSRRLYQVRYSVGANGLRNSMPPGMQGPYTGCVLFFGGSFTFGEGVDDEQSLPYQVALQAGGRVHTYNFGAPGYGPHQMLSALESGYVHDRVQCDGPVVGIHQALSDHVKRVTGRAWWDLFGPRYILDSKVVATRQGSFSDSPFRYYRLILTGLDKSYVFRTLFSSIGYSDSDYRLYAAVVAKSMALFQQQFPEGEFHVLHWGYLEKQETDDALSALRQAGIDPVLTSEVLPGYWETPEKYRLSEYDQHPNAKAYARLAAYVVEHWLP